MTALGCGEGQPIGTPTAIVTDGAGSARAATAAVSTAADQLADDDDIWRGLEPHEIQLDQKLLVVKGPRGVIGCGYLNVAAFEKFGEACAIVPAVDLRSLPDAKVTAVTSKAKELGIEVGMTGREALDKIR
jgi:uncharacterized protein YunC (DUF1805 family)